MRHFKSGNLIGTVHFVSISFKEVQIFDLKRSCSMGCSISKPVANNKKKGSPAGKKKERRNSNQSVDSNDRKGENDCSNSGGSQPCFDYDGELSDEELDELEREQRELIWLEKAHLRNRVRAENMMDGEYILPTTNERSALDLLKQEEEMAILNLDALKRQKQMRRRKLKRKAEKEQKWMVFSNVDCFDEADMSKLSDFLSVIMKAVPTSNYAYNQVNVNGNNDDILVSNNDPNDDNIKNRMKINDSDTRCVHRTGNVVADYLAFKDESNLQPQRNRLVDSIVSKNDRSGIVAIGNEEHSSYSTENLSIDTGGGILML